MTDIGLIMTQIAGLERWADLILDAITLINKSLVSIYVSHFVTKLLSLT